MTAGSEGFAVAATGDEDDEAQNGVLQDRCPDNVLTIGGCAVVFLAEIRAEMAMQAPIAAGRKGGVGSGGGLGLMAIDDGL